MLVRPTLSMAVSLHPSTGLCACLAGWHFVHQQYWMHVWWCVINKQKEAPTLSLHVMYTTKEESESTWRQAPPRLDAAC